MFSLAEEKEREREKKNRCTSGHEPFNTSLYFLLGEWGFERADVNRLAGPRDKVSIMPTGRSRGREGIQEKQNPGPWGRGNATGHKEHTGRFTVENRRVGSVVSLHTCKALDWPPCVKDERKIG